MTLPPELAYDSLDILSNEAHRNGPPHELYTMLREHAPLAKVRGVEAEFPEWVWAVTRHADVNSVSRQFQNYSSAAKGSLMMSDRPDLEMARMLIDLDPPEHTRLRSLVNRGFTPKAMRMLEEHFVEVSERLISDAVATGSVDFVTTVSAELPLIAIAELLGVDTADRHRVFDWSNKMIGSTDPDYSGGPEDAATAAMELYMFANELAADRLKNPGNDIITTLVSADGDDRLTEHEFDLFVLLLAVAGNETTRNGISHGVLALIEQPGVFDQIKNDRSLIPGAVEEMLRWGTPVNNFRRTATCDIELHGQQIKEGDPVVMFYASANRDEDVFKDPFKFDVTRSPNPHVTFGGGGPHFCLGANLARMEMRIAFESFFDHVDAVELTGPVNKLRSHFVHGIKTLPVRLEGRP